VFYIPRAGTVCHNRRFLQDAVIHSRSCIPKTLLKSASQDKMNVLSMTVCRWYQLIVPVCVCKPIFRSFCSKTRGHECGVPSRVLSSFGTREFPTKRLSETTNACHTDKALSETKTLVGNNKALSKSTKLCRQIYS
jgi:hypothetical protein